jgi:hypothetical protein
MEDTTFHNWIQNYALNTNYILNIYLGHLSFIDNILECKFDKEVTH